MTLRAFLKIILCIPFAKATEIDEPSRIWMDQLQLNKSMAKLWMEMQRRTFGYEYCIRLEQLAREAVFKDGNGRKSNG